MGSTPFYHTPGAGPDWDPAASYPPDRIKLNVGKRIQDRLYELGWKQTELAEKAELGRDSISLYIRGKNLPGPRNLKKVADALGVKVNDLAPELQNATRTRQADYGPQAFSQTPDGRWQVRIDRLIDQKTMLKILSALDEYDDAQKSSASKEDQQPEQ
ncbi:MULTISPECIES: helix-turn-helix transcriptional regulator [unclassified Yoonia]|uniref:helix-turn-helix domain-containing protein n=1 Tax=unclassified Yoonia TaxID=2629118 RepID=UPI002AFF86BA|nr:MULTISPECIES: helix-turn-helix transcriptional regulator [unclassified Yoonia]